MGSAARFDAVRTCASHHDPINVVELDAPDDTRWTTKPDSVGATWFDGPAWTDAPSEVEQARFESAAFVQVRGGVFGRLVVGSHQLQTRGAVGLSLQVCGPHHGPRRSAPGRFFASSSQTAHVCLVACCVVRTSIQRAEHACVCAAIGMNQGCASAEKRWVGPVPKAFR
jgi:hypothetical protein